MTSGLWPTFRPGARQPSRLVRVSERRAKLLGLDAPTTSKTQLTGSLGVYAERLAAERELFSTLTIEQMEELAADSQALVKKMTAKANAVICHSSTSADVLLGGYTIDVVSSADGQQPPGRETD